MACPHHPRRAYPACEICAAWMQIDTERKRLSLLQQKLALDKQLVKSEKRRLRRTTQIQESIIDTSGESERSEQDWREQMLKTQEEQEKQYEDMLSRLEQKIALDQSRHEAGTLQLKALHKQEVEDAKTQVKAEAEKWRIQSLELKLKLELETENRMKHEKESKQANELLRGVETEKEVFKTKLEEKEKHMQLIIDQHQLTLNNHKAQVEREVQQKVEQNEQDCALQLKQLVDEKVKLLAQVHELEEFKKSKENELVTVSDRTAALEDEIEAKVAELEVSKATFQVLDQELQKTKADWEEEKTSWDDQKAHWEKAQQEWAGKEAEWEQAKADWDRTKADLEERVGQSGDDTSELHGRIKSLQNQVVELKNQKEQLLANRSVDGASSTCSNCEKLMQEVHDLKMTLNEKREKYEKDVLELEAKMKELRLNGNGATPKSDETERLKALVTELQTIGNEFLEAKERAEEQVEILEDENAGLREDILEIQAENEKLHEELQEQNEDRELQENPELQEELQTAQNTNEELRESLEATQEENGQLKEKIELLRLQEQLNSMETRQNEFLTNHDTQRREVETMVQQNEIRTGQLFGDDLQSLHHQLISMEANLQEQLSKPIPNTDSMYGESVAPSTTTDDLLSTVTPAEAPASATAAKSDAVFKALQQAPILGPYTPPSNHAHVKEFEYVGERQAGKYTGWLDENGMPHGRGILRVDNGDVYGGEWFAGIRHGQGVYTWYEGDLYIGPWNHGKRHGHGAFVFSDGRLYDGEYNNGMREGFGIFTWPYGAKFEGTFKSDKRNGHGEYEYSDGRTYSGEYKDDRPHGHGVERADDGTLIHEGDWQLGEFRGDSVSMMGSIA